MSGAEQGASLTGWAIVELMGHRQLAGEIREVIVAGAPFLRIDVPEAGRRPAFTQIYGASAIYAITPTTEDAARRAAQGFSPPPPVTLLALAAPQPGRCDGDHEPPACGASDCLALCDEGIEELDSASEDEPVE